eukprot:Protomagalhaensia_sp_Gyna_25__5014@NODE_555_length_3134_cov_94_974152_g431_i0_p1_GENE_NODE_555_length_3134_cov_94_974152_g431_i0NODE_555_length_3134_cov_94_974152_g431_i0_p1_ORF_typecomplete_len403_score59_07His_Phos_1/PF00300_22/3_1e21His_Phos_1/PF00300_22/1_2e02_NODE_555_length_3134_cov_94_974152_g431_i06161824
MLTLHLLRHGQAKHNVIDWPEDPSSTFLDEYFDPPLTQNGIQQVQATTCPPQLIADPNAVFWVSPLQRAMQTAVFAIPNQGKGRVFRLLECVRERGGEKACDLRFPLEQIILNAKNMGGKWDWSELPEQDSLRPPVRRESVRDLVPRIVETLQRIQGLSNGGCQNLAIVSHSGFLSALLAGMGLCPHVSRWLSNAEWRTVTIKPAKALEAALRRMSVTPRPFCRAIEPKSAAVANALAPLEVPSSCRHQQVQYCSSESLAALTFSTRVLSRELVVLPYPLPIERGNKKDVIASFIAHWDPSAEEVKDDYAPDIVSPPYVFNGTVHVYQPHNQPRLQYHEEGTYAFGDVALICDPLPQPASSPFPLLPLWVSSDYLRTVHDTALAILDELAAQSVCVVLPHDN